MTEYRASLDAVVRFGNGGDLTVHGLIRAGMITCPGLPAPAIEPDLTRQASRQHYAAGTEFAIDRLTLVGNTVPTSTPPIIATLTAPTSAP